MLEISALPYLGPKTKETQREKPVNMTKTKKQGIHRVELFMLIHILEVAPSINQAGDMLLLASLLY